MSRKRTKWGSVGRSQGRRKTGFMPMPEPSLGPLSFRARQQCDRLSLSLTGPSRFERAFEIELHLILSRSQHSRQTNTANKTMSDNERADHRRRRHRVRRPLYEQNERSPTVANHAFEPIEDMPVPQPVAATVAEGPPKQRKRPRPTYDFEYDDDMPAREQPQQRTTKLPPPTTRGIPFSTKLLRCHLT